MVVSIDNLKKIIHDGMALANAKRRVEIRRGANNILRVHGRLVTWIDLQDMLANGEYDLVTKDGKTVVDSKERGWGGARVAGPGKKIGQPKKPVAEKKRPVSFSMSNQTRDKLDELCEKLGKKRSEVLELLVNEKIESIE